jgi:lipopolysaccharide/colanic/teichoic acid biosynthesis glycosyltransferase
MLAAASSGYESCKRIIDIAGALVGLLLASPILFLAAAAIKFTDGGPVFFHQMRVGRRGRLFPFIKLRSMVLGAESIKRDLLNKSDLGNSVTFKMKSDPRVTRVGSLLRRTSIDELPQLWCVLKGDMSLVGPRPLLINEGENHSVAARRRLEVVPGLTCLWQVSGRSDIPFAGQVKLDIEYVNKRGPWLDTWLVLRTIPAVLSRRGAY